MGQRKLAIILVLALVSAIAIGQRLEPTPYADKLISIQAEQKLGFFDHGLLDQPLEVQAMLLDYLGDGEFDPRTANGQLVMKTWIALAKYPAQTREILQLYGVQPEFQAILREYGEGVIPIIEYFLLNDLNSLRAMNAVGNAIASAGQSVTSLRNRLKGNAQPSELEPTSTKAEYGPLERGWYAIHSIHQGGHKFLSQFAIDKENIAHWNQTERTVMAVGSFFTSGVASIERKYQLDETISGGDVFFAAVDVIPFVAAVKLLKVGKSAAATGKELSLIGKTRTFGARLIPKNRFLKSLAGPGVVLATGYVLVRHPGLINSLLGGLAKFLGINPMLFQAAFWFLVIFVALYPFTWILKLLAKATLRSFAWLEKSGRMNEAPIQVQ